MKKLYLFSDVSKESGFQKEVSEELISDVLGKDKIAIISGYPYDVELSEEKVKNITNNFGKIGIKFNKVEITENNFTRQELEVLADAYKNSHDIGNSKNIQYDDYPYRKQYKNHYDFKLSKTTYRELEEINSHDGEFLPD